MHNRRSIRLKDYDYRQNGAYFVTICSHERLCLFGSIGDGEMVLNDWGRITQTSWSEIPAHYPMVELDVFVVMPNHVHGIIVITGDNELQSIGAQHGATPNNVAPNSLGSIVRTFKAAVTRHINRLLDAPDHPIWQRNYHEHIIRNENTLNTIRAYVDNNPAKWAEDSLYVE